MIVLFQKFSKKQKAQEIIQFAIIAPILILFLLIITDFGIAIVTKNAVADAARASIIRVSNLNLISGATEAAKITSVGTFIDSGITTYFADHNIPKRGTITINISPDANGNYHVRVVYMYKSFFNSLFIPAMANIPIQTSHVINAQLLKPNTYSGISTEQLSGFFPIPLGTLVNGEISLGYNIRNYTALLVSWLTDADLDNNGASAYARLFSWYGEDLLPQNLRINVRTATLEVRSPYYNLGAWLNTKIPYVWVVSALGYTQVLYVKYNAAGNIGGGGIGYELNACDLGVGSKYSRGARAFQPTLKSCPYQGENIFGIRYYETYRLNPTQYKNDFYTGNFPDANERFSRSFGYRWCGTDANTGVFCKTSNLTGTQTIQELALRGTSREGWYEATVTDYSYVEHGNYEYIGDTNAALPDLQNLYHYVAYTSDYDHYDRNYVVNIWQPMVNDNPAPALTNYASTDNPIDYAKLTNINGPFYTAFKWSFNLNGLKILDSGAANTIIHAVYLDDDGDGIPNAWDDHPNSFDVDGDGRIDGTKYFGIVPIAEDHQLNTTGISYNFPITDVQGKYIAATAENSNRIGSNPTSRAALSAGVDGYPFGTTEGGLIPRPYYIDFRVHNTRLYVQCNYDSIPFVIADDICTTIPSPASPRTYTNVAATLNIKKSLDLLQLEADDFSAANYVIRTPPVGLWP